MVMRPDTQQVFDLFHNHPVEGYACTEVADKLNLGIPTARRLLQELATMGRIRMTRNRRGKLFYVVVSEPVVESAPTQLPAFKPLEGYAVEMRRIAASAVAGR